MAVGAGCAGCLFGWPLEDGYSRPGYFECGDFRARIPGARVGGVSAGYPDLRRSCGGGELPARCELAASFPPLPLGSRRGGAGLYCAGAGQ